MIWTRFVKNFLDSASIGTELFKILPTAQSLLVLDGGYAEMANLILAYINLVIDSGKNLKISLHSRLCLLLLHKFKNYCFTICNFNNFCILSKKKITIEICFVMYCKKFSIKMVLTPKNL